MELSYMATSIKNRTPKRVNRFVYTLLERVELKKAAARRGDYSLDADPGKPGHSALHEYVSWAGAMDKRLRTA